MKKLKPLLVLFFAFLINYNAIAQRKDSFINEGEIRPFEPHFSFEYGGNIGVSSNKTFDWVLGGDVRAQYYFSKNNIVTFTTGFSNAFTNNTKDLGFIPMKFGFKKFITENKFYIQGEAGIGIAATNHYGGTNFLWAPSFGYVSHSSYDISVRYESLSKFDVNQIAVRLAFEFTL